MPKVARAVGCPSQVRLAAVADEAAEERQVFPLAVALVLSVSVTLPFTSGRVSCTSVSGLPAFNVTLDGVSQVVHAASGAT